MWRLCVLFGCKGGSGRKRREKVGQADGWFQLKYVVYLVQVHVPSIYGRERENRAKNRAKAVAADWLDPLAISSFFFLPAFASLVGNVPTYGGCGRACAAALVGRGEVAECEVGGGREGGVVRARRRGNAPLAGV